MGSENLAGKMQNLTVTPPETMLNGWGVGGGGEGPVLEHSDPTSSEKLKYSEAVPNQTKQLQN